MKGFGIYVKNDLLEPKHFKAIGQALWLYLWLLDKMTSISEDGIGKVLGGSPIKLTKIAKDLPMSDKSYTRYIERLEKFGYITALRTPYGYVFTITKAKKIFKSIENRKSYDSVNERTVKVAGENRKSGGNKEDNTEDNTNTTAEQSSEEELSNNNSNMSWDTNKYSDEYLEDDYQIDPDHKPVKKEKKSVSDEIQQVFDLFDNPAKKVWRLREIERESAKALFETYGIETLQKRMERIKKEQKNNDPLFPLVVTPSQLLDKMPNVERYLGI